MQKAQGTSLEAVTVYTYEDGNLRAVSCADQDHTNDRALVSVMDYDQLGRVRLTRQMETASCASADDDTTGIKVQTRYLPGIGVDYTLVSNPFRETTSGAAAVNSTMGWTRTTRDADGRTTATQSFDGSGLPAPWGSNGNSLGTVSTGYNAQVTTVTDQAGKNKQLTYDPFGQLGVVIEDLERAERRRAELWGELLLRCAGGSGFGGAGVLSGGLPGEDVRLRFAGADEAGLNPESGTVTYGYDDDGNLMTRIDARLIATSYTYDALNRVKTKTYAGGTPGVTYSYDTGATNGIGRLTQVTNGNSTTQFSAYDALGRVTQSSQTTGAQTYSLGYGYNLAASMTS